MNALRTSLVDYIQLRRSLGYKFQRQARQLEAFVSFMERRGVTRISVPIAVEWAMTAGGTAGKGIALTAARGFARHLCSIDSGTQVPPAGLIRYNMRTKPYFYSDDEIQRLMVAAQQLPGRGSKLRARSMYCFVGLIATTGLRSGEARRLQCDDVDLKCGMLTIRGTKFGKSRLVPLHASTRKILSDYATQRDASLPHRKTRHFFVGSRGRQIYTQHIHATFAALLRTAGIQASGNARQPRLHDLRHRFAVQTLTRWYRAGEDVERRIPELSTYLGHTVIRDTYWYLSATPDLMAEAAKRLDQRETVSS